MKKNRLTGLALACLLLFGACSAAPSGSSAQTAAMTQSAADQMETSSDMETAENPTKITAEAAKARMDSGDPIVILDVRTAEEFAETHIPGAVLLPNEEIGTTPPAQLPDHSAEILVYCRSGRRSAEAAKKLAAMGYTNVFDFGGIRDWPYETETGSAG